MRVPYAMVSDFVPIGVTVHMDAQGEFGVRVKHGRPVVMVETESERWSANGSRDVEWTDL